MPRPNRELRRNALRLIPRLALLAHAASFAACATPANSVPSEPAAVVEQSPEEAFAHYWSLRLEQHPGPDTWRDLCDALDQWPSLEAQTVNRLDAAMNEWPADLRVAPERWQAFGDVRRTPAWALVRYVVIDEARAGRLSSALPHLDSITTVRLVGDDAVTAFAASPALPNARAIRLEGVTVTGLQKLTSSRGGTITLLDLWENNVGPELSNTLASRSWPRLEVLDLGANGLNVDAMKRLADLEAPNLRELVLSFNAFGDEGFAAFAASPHALERLELRATNISPAVIDDLDAIGTTRLQVLDLSDNALGDDAVRALTALPLNELRTLRLNGTGITAGATAALSPQLTPGLEVLELGRNELGDAGVAPLCVEGASGLRFVVLDATRLTTEGVSIIAGCPHLTGLRSLSLHNNDAFDDTTMRILAAGDFASLTALGLDGCTVGDDGLAALSTADWWPRLTRLRLEGNAFTDDSADVFQELPTGLVNLGLGWNEFSKAAIVGLGSANLRSLRVLSLRGNPLDGPALRALRNAKWLGTLLELDLRSLPFEQNEADFRAIAEQLRDDAMLRRD